MLGWDVLERIRLRKLEYRTRNVDELRLTVLDRLKEFSADGPRAETTLILTEAESALTEALAIMTDIAAVVVPDSEPEAQAKQIGIANHCMHMVTELNKVMNALRFILVEQDKRDADAAGDTATD